MSYDSAQRRPGQVLLSAPGHKSPSLNFIDVRIESTHERERERFYEAEECVNLTNSSVEY